MKLITTMEKLGKLRLGIVRRGRFAPLCSISSHEDSGSSKRYQTIWLDQALWPRRTKDMIFLVRKISVVTEFQLHVKYFNDWAKRIIFTDLRIVQSNWTIYLLVFISARPWFHKQSLIGRPPRHVTLHCFCLFIFFQTNMMPWIRLALVIIPCCRASHVSFADLDEKYACLSRLVLFLDMLTAQTLRSKAIAERILMVAKSFRLFV